MDTNISYGLPPAGGRIRSQGNYCLPPAGVLHSQNKVIKCAAYGVAQGRGGGMGGWVGGKMDIRGECGFSSLVEQKIKGKNYAVFCFAGNIYIYIYI